MGPLLARVKDCDDNLQRAVLREEMKLEKIPALKTYREEARLNGPARGFQKNVEKKKT